MIVDNTIYLFNNKKEVVTTISPRDVLVSEQTSEINATIKHVVQALYTDEVENSMYFGMKDIENSDNFLMYKIDKLTVDNSIFVLDGTHIFFDDLSGRGGIIEDYNPENELVSDAIGIVIAGTGWEIGTANTTNTLTSKYEYRQKIDVFWDMLKKGNIEFTIHVTFENGKIVSKIINISDEIGTDNGKWYEYGDKLISVQKEVKSTNIFTAFIGIGKTIKNESGVSKPIKFTDEIWRVADNDPIDKPHGQDYVNIEQSTERYGYEDGTPRFTVVDFNDIEVESELLQVTYDYAVRESRPKVHFKSEVLDDEVAHLGERVRIIRDDINIRYSTRVFKMVRDFKNKRIKTFEFGDKLIYTYAERKKRDDEILEDLLDNIDFDTDDGEGGESPPPDGYMVVVKHGTNASRERPIVDGATSVYWVGTVAPIYATEGDQWFGGPI